MSGNAAAWGQGMVLLGHFPPGRCSRELRLTYGYSVQPSYVLAVRYWDRPAVEALLALPRGTIVVVPSMFVRGYAKTWSEQFRRDLVILAPEEVTQ